MGYELWWQDDAFRISHSRRNLIGALRHFGANCRDEELTSTDIIVQIINGFQAIDDLTVEMLVRIVDELGFG